ncbi:response regulator [Marinomonas sp. PE14-40]|uniref:response regulator n=1 Tax=Marinomonas sp. PE14-40 TaxID=3060621 RepID=UPI003F66BD56
MTRSKTVFVVDDDAEIRNLLKTYLEKHQFNVRTADSGESFLADFEQDSAADLIILDIMLPGEDGFSVCRSLRMKSLVPVIMLTANSDEMDRIIGLEIGADDYLAKPFNPRELLARMKAIFRRIEQISVTNQDTQVDAQSDGPNTKSNPCIQKHFRFADFCLDTLSRELSHQDGSVAALSGADYNLLMLFLNNPGTVLSRDFIAENTRGRDSAPLDRFIDVHISRLRQRLHEDARHPQLIKTIRGEGYILTVDVDCKDANSVAL